MKIKRIFDFCIASVLLLLFLPLILLILFLIWLQDFKNPFYIADRVGQNGKIFRMYKFRSMIVNADHTGVDSTGNNDQRITKVGKIIRNYKLDELSQLINVFIGHMSLVGPRPNVKRETDAYSNQEKIILSVRPGITDLSSIVFADEGDILADKEDPDLAYNQLIRPYKSSLAIAYVKNQSFSLDLKILLLTALNFINRSQTLKQISKISETLNGDVELSKVCLRNSPLKPKAPPGFDSIIESR